MLLFTARFVGLLILFFPFRLKVHLNMEDMSISSDFTREFSQSLQIQQNHKPDNSSRDLLGPENAKKYKTYVFLAGSASAEFIADIALCPFEAVKVRMQTTIPPAFTGTVSGISSIVGKEGVAG